MFNVNAFNVNATKSCFAAIKTIATAHLSDEQFEIVWKAFLDRCSISMVEPDMEGWTQEMLWVWDVFWSSKLNPF